MAWRPFLLASDEELADVFCAAPEFRSSDKGLVARRIRTAVSHAAAGAWIRF
jgi:hypothetical protein